MPYDPSDIYAALGIRPPVQQGPQPSPDEMTLAAAMGGAVPSRQRALDRRRRLAEMLFQTPTPQGRQVGRTYVASSPLEHLASAMSRAIGAGQMRGLDRQEDALGQQAESAARAQFQIDRGDKDRTYGLQLRGAQRQEAADAAEAARYAAETGRKAEADKAEVQYRADTLGLKRDELKLRGSELAAARAAKEAEAADKKRAAGSKAAEDLRKEFQGLQTYKNTQAVAESYKKIAGTSETGPGDMSLIFGYMKMLDPGSTVREGEYATAQQAGSVPQNIVAAYNRAVGGEKLAPEVRKQFRDEAKKILQAQSDRYEETAKPYRRLAEQAGIAPGDVVLDLGLGSAVASQPGAQRAVVRTGTNTKTGKKVIQYDDGTIEEQP